MDVSALFERYTDAFNDLNANAIADCYLLPCAIVDADGTQVFIESVSLVNKFEKNCADMKKMQYQSASFEILDSVKMGVTAEAVNIQWHIKTTQNTIFFNSLYICHLIDGEWRLFSANVYMP